MEDRQPTKPNYIRITLDDGTVMTGYLERIDEPTAEGTPLNKNTLFNSNNTERFGADLPSEAFELIGRKIDVTIPASGWAYSDTDGYYSNTVAVEEMLEVHEPVLTVNITDAENAEAERDAFSRIYVAESSDGSVTFKALVPPEIDLPVRMSGV